MAKSAATREMIEGPEAWKRFTGAMKRILGISKRELKRRDEAWHRTREDVKRQKAK
jgi:hypothetical protein